VFRAVGRAHLATNIPIFTHTGIPGKSALEQLDVFEDVGVDPKHVVIVTSETSLTRTPRSAARSAGAGHLSASTDRAVRTTIRSCRWSCR
jgi:predicted metal-dependent phosphotriesterase family hydrolase